MTRPRLALFLAILLTLLTLLELATLRPELGSLVRRLLVRVHHLLQQLALLATHHHLLSLELLLLLALLGSQLLGLSGLLLGGLVSSTGGSEGQASSLSLKLTLVLVASSLVIIVRLRDGLVLDAGELLLFVFLFTLTFIIIGSSDVHATIDRLVIGLLGGSGGLLNGGGLILHLLVAILGFVVILSHLGLTLLFLLSQAGTGVVTTTRSLDPGAQVRRESGTGGVKIGAEQLAIVDTVPHPLGLNVCASGNTSTRLDLRSGTLGRGGNGGERALGKLGTIDDLVSDTRVGLVMSESTVTEYGVPTNTLAAESAQNELKRGLGGLTRDVESEGGEESTGLVAAHVGLGQSVGLGGSRFETVNGIGRLLGVFRHRLIHRLIQTSGLDDLVHLGLDLLRNLRVRTITGLGLAGLDRLGVLGDVAALEGEGSQLSAVLVTPGIELRGVSQSDRGVQAEVDEAQQGGVEIDKGGHNTVVNVAVDTLNESVGYQPHDILALDGGLVVDTLDGKESLAQRVGANQVVLELVAEALAESNGLVGDMIGRGEGGEQEEQRQGIVEVAKSVDESWVALLDDMVKGEFWSVVLLEARGVADFTTTQGTSDLLGESLLVTELVEQGLVEQILDVLGVVEGGVGGGGLGGLLLVPGLTGVDSY